MSKTSIIKYRKRLLYTSSSSSALQMRLNTRFSEHRRRGFCGIEIALIQNTEEQNHSIGGSRRRSTSRLEMAPTTRSHTNSNSNPSSSHSNSKQNHNDSATTTKQTIAILGTDWAGFTLSQRLSTSPSLRNGSGQ
jgi:hypothetical protein